MNNNLPEMPDHFNPVYDAVSESKYENKMDLMKKYYKAKWEFYYQ